MGSISSIVFCFIALTFLLIMVGSETQVNSMSPYANSNGKFPKMKSKKMKHGASRLTRYTPDWNSLDSRPIPSWYDDAKFGIFVHWGVFSVPAFGDAWFWQYWTGWKDKRYVDFMANNYRPGFTYPEFAPMFTAEFFDPVQWADIFKSSGAKYVVLTSKHHEGYTLWPSKYSWNWNSVDVGSNRDLVGDLATAIRLKTDLKFGLYHSLFEFFHPLYIEDKQNNWTTQDFVRSKTMPELYELVNKYKPSVVWSDGDWEVGYDYWNSTQFIAWLYNDSPVKDEVVVNDRWGDGSTCKHGDFYTCSDGFNPGTLQPHKWENCFMIDRYAWAYRRNAVLNDFRSVEELLQVMIETISCGGNFLLNVGPTHDGMIGPIFEERLRQIGQWLQVNGEAIYKSRPWIYQNDTLTPGVWYTKSSVRSEKQKTNSVYAIVLSWPESNLITLAAPTISKETTISFLGYPGSIKWSNSSSGIQIRFPPRSKVKSNWAWVFRLDNLVY